MKKAFSVILVLVMIFAFTIQSAAAFTTVDGTTRLVNPDGTPGEKYTGWATSSSTGNKFYFNDGVRVTGVYVMDGTRHVFDSKGVWLGGRTNSKEEYSVIFENDYNVSAGDMKDGSISFDVKINQPNGRKPEDFGGDPNFSLFVYKDGAWRTVKQVENNLAWMYRMEASQDMLLHFSAPAAIFGELEPGLYRVKAKVWYTDGTEVDHGTYTTLGTVETEVRGEFNLV
ncbi:MAG: hypothetical protein FWH08_07165 [Oscillospiraceae bacterium]|nr:hypothetical protein [Oscillospiraceae bacterium]